MKKLFTLILLFASISSYAQNSNSEISISDKVQKITEDNIFCDTLYHNWCNSIIKGEDGKYHLVYSRWPRSIAHNAWLTHSTVEHAISDNPEGPYKHVGTLLNFNQPIHKAGEMITAHNPKIKFFEGKYHLYFISSWIDKDVDDAKLKEIAKAGPSHEDWMPKLRANQRTFVATADSLTGEWEVCKEPILEPSGPIKTLVVNPAITQGGDGRYYMIVKGDKPGTTKFLRNQAIAVSNYPDKDFIIQDKPVIEDWDTEDVSMWYDNSSEKFYAVFHAHKYVGMMVSEDGINWDKAKDFRIKEKLIERADNEDTIIPLRMERPFVYVENNVPKVLSMAIYIKGQSFIVTIPLK